MTRKEEINQEANNRIKAEGMDKEWVLCYFDAFTTGAEWADSHPINVWHNASEEPLRDRVFLADLGASRYGFQTFFIFENDTKFNWSEWVKEVRLLRWAYISDLLPKE